MAKGKSTALIPGTLVASVLLLTTACGSPGSAVPEVAPVPLHLKIGRLDKDLFATADDTEGNFNLRLYAKYGEFYRTYVERILKAAAFNDPRLPLALSHFVHNPDWAGVQQRADSVLGDMSAQEAGFDNAFGRLKAWFPDSLVPRIIAFNSGFNYGVVPTDSVLGFGVEWFVGKDDPVVRYLPPDMFPQYRKDRMRPDMLVPGVVKGWLEAHYARDTRGDNLLANLVDAGKVAALLDALLPQTADSLKFAFTPQQLKWCRGNEFNIWKEIVGKELLWSKDPKVIDRFMNDGPFTSGFPRESPGHLGQWIGYRMVQAYLREHPGTTFAQLFAMRNPQAVLKTYKPR